MVGTPEWYAWLKAVSTFTFSSEYGSFMPAKSLRGTGAVESTGKHIALVWKSFTVPTWCTSNEVCIICITCITCVGCIVGSAHAEQGGEYRGMSAIPEMVS